MIEGSAPLVTIVMPLYNAEHYVAETIESVLAQTLSDWNLVVVDDCSTDDSYRIVAEYAASDSRIRHIRLMSNGGAARARNAGVLEACGRYLAFIDADDIWMPEKLERQIDYMRQSGVAMCFTSYETVGPDGAHRNFVRVPHRIGYRGFLKNTITCSHTIVFDLEIVDRSLLICPNYGDGFDFPEDMVVWLQVLKTGVMAYGIEDILAKYRRHASSRSADKRRAVARTWNAYRRVEKLSVPYSAYCLFWQLFHAMIKRI